MKYSVINLEALVATFNHMYFHARSSTTKERILQNTKASTLATITYYKTALEASENLRVIAYNPTRNYKKKKNYKTTKLATPGNNKILRYKSRSTREILDSIYPYSPAHLN